jgi:drug/metabolite transporter (DMT)-like permease
LSLMVFLAVLLAALLHASWNVMVKLNLDRFLSLFLIQTMMGAMGLVMLVMFAWPNAESVPYALTSGLLHTGYNLFLARSYRHGDLSQVYPIARGTAPMLTLIGSSLLVNEPIGIIGVTGVVLLVAGIWTIALGGKGQLRLDRTTLLYALGTSVFIGLYTIVDGLGARVSAAPSGYVALVFVLDAVFLGVAGFYLRGPNIFKTIMPYWRNGLLGAGFSASAYWIVVWAMTEAPIAAVAALRETSILFVMAMSAKLLEERIGLGRTLGAVLVVMGAAALRFN